MENLYEDLRVPSDMLPLVSRVSRCLEASSKELVKCLTIDKLVKFDENKVA